MQTSEPRDPYGAALGAVRRLARTGRFVPGEPIVVTELAAEVGFSPTPVREALACLSGEGLIERRRGRGYFYPALTPSDLIDLFELQLAYLHAALTLHPRGIGPLRKAVSGIGRLDGAQTLFAAIIAHSANGALTLAHQRLVHRLGGVLHHEREADDGTGAEVQSMIASIIDGELHELVQQLQTYHDNRCARAPRMVIQIAE